MRALTQNSLLPLARVSGFSGKFYDLTFIPCKIPVISFHLHSLINSHNSIELFIYSDSETDCILA